MTLQLVGNNVSNVNFSSKHNQKNVIDSRAKATAFVNMNDDQLKSLAYLTSVDSKREKKSRQSIIATLYALPVVDVLSTGILAKTAKGAPASLSERLLESSKKARGWAGTLIALGVCAAVGNKLSAKSDSYNDFKSNHPGASFILDVGAFFGLIEAGRYVNNKMLNKYKAAKPESFEKAIDRLDSVSAKIDKGSLNTKFLKKAVDMSKSFRKAAPWAADASKFVLRNSVWVVLAGGFMSAASHARKNKNKIENNYNDLKKAQLKVAKHMTNVLGVERDVLAQSHKEMAKDLRRAIDGQKPVSSEEIAEFEAQKHSENI